MTPELTKALLIGLIGLTGAFGVNRGMVAYHDGLRTRIPEIGSGESTRPQLAKFAYSISVGFIVAYALPFSLATGIIIIHIILLASDMIGVYIADTKLAALAGFLYASLATLLIDSFVSLIKHLPPIVPDLSLLWLPLGYTFPLLPAMAAAQVFGLAWGIAGALFTLGVWKLSELAMQGSLTAPMTFTGGSIALFLTSVLVIAAAYRRTTEPAFDIAEYDRNMVHVRRKVLYLVPAAALLSMAASQYWMAGEPIQLVLLAQHQPGSAALVALFSTMGFLPMMAMTGLVSGVWNQDGYPDWILGAGYVLGNPILAFFGGAAVMTAELVSLRRVGRLLSSHPGIHDLGGAMRDAMDIVPTLSILAGAVYAAMTIGGAGGALVVVGATALNDLKGRPIIPMAMPVFAYLLVGLGVGFARHAGIA